jgi:hypothetical protein
MDPTHDGSRRILEELAERTKRIEYGEDPGGKARDARLAAVETKVDRLQWAIIAFALVSGALEFVRSGGAGVVAEGQILIADFARILGLG